jgi:hypothetical protein
MKFLPTPVRVDEEEGFVDQKDIFGRRAFAGGLTNLVTGSDDPLVILLDSAWGTGKTTFIKMWMGELRKLQIPVIYFDAFENDHVDNGFVAIAAEVVGLGERLKKAESPAYRTFLKRAGRLGGVFLRVGARIGVKAATLGAIDASDIDALKSVAEDVAKDTSTKADEYIESILKLQSQEKESLAALRSSLEDLAKDIAGQEAGRPVVFIVDELDRCRPNFALELLEHIKHIFSISNVHFVLAAQMSQLENSVKFSYGPDIDARTYLQKFYNVLVHFPEREVYRHDRPIPRFVNHLRQTMELDKDAMSIVAYCAESRNLSFRAVERIATCVSLARAFVPQNYLWIAPIVALLCVMKVVEPELFRRARDGRITIREVKDFVLQPGPRSGGVEINTEWVMALWNYCLAKDEPDRTDGAMQAVRNFLFGYSVDRERIVPLMVSYLDSFQSSAS